MTDLTPRLADLNDDTAPYPAQVTIFCDDCGTEHTADYLVAAGSHREQRFEIARTHLRTVGWSCDEDGDLCPACAPNAQDGTGLLRAWLAELDSADDAAEAHGRPILHDNQGRVAMTVHNFDRLIPPMGWDEVAALRAVLDERDRLATRVAELEGDEVVIGAGSPEASALTHCPTCGAPEWHEDGRRGWNPVNVECEDCAAVPDDDEEED